MAFLALMAQYMKKFNLVIQAYITNRCDLYWTYLPSVNVQILFSCSRSESGTKKRKKSYRSESFYLYICSTIYIIIKKLQQIIVVDCLFYLYPKQLWSTDWLMNLVHLIYLIVNLGLFYSSFFVWKVQGNKPAPPKMKANPNTGQKTLITFNKSLPLNVWMNEWICNLYQVFVSHSVISIFSYLLKLISAPFSPV